ncbi:MAG: carbohydrate ABC transporter permease [Lachnospirales bacterium]
MAVSYKHIKESRSDVIFHVCNTILLLLCFIIVAVPLLNVLASSLSTPNAVVTGKVGIWPVGWNIDAYVQIFQSRMLLTGYANSILYTVVGTVINIVMTVMAAYPLAIKKFVGRGIFTGLFVFTMIFSAPLIPTYLNIRDLGLLDTMWALVLPGAISVYNMIIARTYFQNSIPEEMLEAAGLDGANDTQILLKLVLPLSKSIIAVLTLYYAVAHWNAYFDPYIYLNSEEKFTLQVVLRNIMSTAAALQEMTDTISADQSQRAALIEVLKYAIIVFGSLPVILLYPFVQKHFVKGVMIGSLKG